MLYPSEPLLPHDRERDRSDNRAAWDDILHDEARMTNVKQPWASAILEFHKNYENRAAELPCHGWVLIVASKAVGRRAEWDEAMASLRSKIEGDKNTSGAMKTHFLTRLDDMEPHDFSRGGIVGAMWVRDSIPPPHLRGWGREPGMAFSMGRLPNKDTCIGAPWRDIRRHAWEISKIIRFDSLVPIQGCQSSYRFYRTHKDRDRVHEALLDQLEAHDPSGAN